MAKPVKTHSNAKLTASTATFDEILEAQLEAKQRANAEARKKHKDDPLARRCNLCGDLFNPTRNWQTYCSNYCRVTAFKKKAEDEMLRLAAEINELRQENTALRARLAELEK